VLAASQLLMLAVPTPLEITKDQSLLLLKKSGCVVVLLQIHYKVYSGVAFSFL